MVQYTDDISVRLYQYVGSDRAICDTARVSTLGAEAERVVPDLERDGGLISYLMKNKHGSPFEHGLMTFVVTAPIFVFWDHVRHRIGVSYNIESSRYKQLEPMFFMPKLARIQSGKPGAYKIEAGTDLQTSIMRSSTQRACMMAWDEYMVQIEQGIAREQAMQVLPMNTVISAYVTFNPRSLMKFLELRFGPARKEMQQLAQLYCDLFVDYWPITAGAFLQNGMVAP